MTMTASQVEQLVDQLYAATAVGDWATAEAMLGDDLVITEADGIPLAGVYRGRGALRELYTKAFSLMDAVALDRVQTTVGGDYAVVILSIRFADPALKPAELCEMFRFQDGKVVEIKPYYFDHAAVNAACAAK